MTSPGCAAMTPRTRLPSSSPGTGCAGPAPPTPPASGQACHYQRQATQDPRTPPTRSTRRPAGTARAPAVTPNSIMCAEKLFGTLTRGFSEGWPQALTAVSDDDRHALHTDHPFADGVRSRGRGCRCSVVPVSANELSPLDCWLAVADREDAAAPGRTGTLPSTRPVCIQAVGPGAGQQRKSDWHARR
jgi:hypothetical protein